MTNSVPHFQEELDQLKGRLLVMGGLAEERVRAAIQALVERDHALVDAVLGGDTPINQLHIEIDGRCVKLLALYQPMAVDLRMILSAVKINTDLERVGDLAINIAEAVRRYMRHPPVQEPRHRHEKAGGPGVPVEREACNHVGAGPLSVVPHRLRVVPCK